MGEERPLSEIQSLARGLRILDILGTTDDSVGITELAAQLEMDKSSVSRMMQTLATYGYAEQDPGTRRYRLGPQVVSLGQALLRRMPLRDQANPFLHRLVEITGECAHLGILAQGQVLYIDQVESPATLRVNTGIGTLAPLHSTALGKCLLAFGDVPVPGTLEAFTARTITDHRTLEAHLSQTRRQGYAVDDEEYSYGVRCVAVPVYDYRSYVVGAVGISGPAGRIGLERLPALAAEVREVGESLSSKLSFKRQ